MQDSLIEELLQRVMIRLKEENLLEASIDHPPILCLGSSQQEQLILKETSSRKFRFLKRVPRGFDGNEIWILHLKFEDLMALSQGLTTSYGDLISLLLEGKQIKIYMDYCLTHIDNKLLNEKSKKAVQELEKMGFILLESSFNNLEEMSKSKSEAINGEKVFTGKLITEEFVMSLPMSVSKLIVSPSALITPLAKDMLKARKINYINKDSLNSE